MPSISVRIPQLGEGLQEALLVEFLKKPGDQIRRDEPIYVMETDKATTDVESPYEGTLEAWTVEEGTVLQIGQEVARMMVAGGVREMPSAHGAPQPVSASAVTVSASETTASMARSAPDQKIIIPPRTRRYLKEKGLLELAPQMPISGTKLTPDDVDRYLKSQRRQLAADLDATDNDEAENLEEDNVRDGFQEQTLSKTQQTLNYRMQRGVQACVPVTMMQEVDWTAINEARKITRNRDGESGFVMLLWCVVQALQNHSKFRSSLIGAKTLRTFEHVHLGIAVALPDDGLVTAVVKNADEMTREQFNDACLSQIKLARNGTDQIDATTTMTVSNIGASGIRWGIPAIVSPAVATLAIGEIFEKPVSQGNSFEFRKTAQLVLSFDHRVANGVGAAGFLNEICENIQRFRLNSWD